MRDGIYWRELMELLHGKGIMKNPDPENNSQRKQKNKSPITSLEEIARYFKPIRIRESEYAKAERLLQQYFKLGGEEKENLHIKNFEGIYRLENKEHSIVDCFTNSPFTEKYKATIYNGLIQEHNLIINALAKKKRQPLTLTPTRYTGLSLDYAARIAAMDKEISAEELNVVIAMLRLGPLLTASQVLGEVFADKSKPGLSKQTQKQVENLMRIYQGTVSGETPIGQLLRKTIPEGRKATIFDPQTGTVQQFNEMLMAGRACTAIYSAQDDALKLKDSPAEAFAEDSAVGGSIHYKLNGVGQASYNRLYLAVDREGNPLAFFDAIESGDISRNTVQPYIGGELEYVLLGSFAASIVIANRLGLSRISFGDLEMVEMARHLGFGERKVFKQDEDNRYQKLGYVGGTGLLNDGPHLWLMGRDKAFRTVDPRLFTPEILPSIANKAYQVMERIKANPKSRKTLGAEYERFFSMVDTIYEEARPLFGETMYQRLHQDVASFCQEYKLKLHEEEQQREPLLPAPEELSAISPQPMISQVA